MMSRFLHSCQRCLLPLAQFDAYLKGKHALHHSPSALTAPCMQAPASVATR